MRGKRIKIETERREEKTVHNKDEIRENGGENKIKTGNGRREEKTVYNKAEMRENARDEKG